MSYAIAPLVGWLVSGTIKSIHSSITAGRFQTDFLGYGGVPSTHSTIVCTTATLIWAKEGARSPVFALAVTVAILVMMDAVSLRQWVGQQAMALNLLRADEPGLERLRERIGHKPLEILAGIALGIACGYVLSWMG
ncbi:MAG: divergent PAP2 family protein [Deltaproteobacteria bacterium]